MSYDAWKTTPPDDDPEGEQQDFEDLDPDLFCLRHGKELPMGPYGVRYGGCEDCEPDGDEAYDRACEIAARRDPTHPANVAMRKVKTG